MQPVVVVPYGRFGTTCRCPEDGTDRCPETSVINYHYSMSNNPEEHSSHPFRGGSLKITQEKPQSAGSVGYLDEGLQAELPKYVPGVPGVPGLP